MDGLPFGCFQFELFKRRIGAAAWLPCKSSASSLSLREEKTLPWGTPVNPCTCCLGEKLKIQSSLSLSGADCIAPTKKHNQPKNTNHQPQPSSSWPMHSSSQSWPTPWSDHHHHPKPSCSPLFSVHHLPQHQVGAKHLWASPSTTRPGEQLVNMRASPILAIFLFGGFSFSKPDNFHSIDPRLKVNAKKN